jgi:hypothetical protein
VDCGGDAVALQSDAEANRLESRMTVKNRAAAEMTLPLKPQYVRLFFVVYGAVLLAGAVLLSGGGHGPWIVARSAAAPLSGISWFPGLGIVAFWYVLAELLIYRRPLPAIVFLLVHYIGLIWVLSGSSREGTGYLTWLMAVKEAPAFAIPIIAVYLSGQVVAWRTIVAGGRSRPADGWRVIRDSRPVDA